MNETEPLFSIENRCRPILKWAGGKSQLLARLFELFPSSFDRYVEPFAGGAAVFFALHRNKRAWLNDINPEIHLLYKVLRTRPEDLVAELSRMRRTYSEDFYYRLRAQKLRSPVRLAARTVFLNKTGYNGLYRQNRRGQFNVPFGRGVNCPELIDVENIERVSRRLRRARLTNLDFEKVIDRCGAGDLVYCDPPYEPLSETSSFNAYWGKGFNRAEQERLCRAAERAVARGATAIVSNSEAPFILDLYRQWQIHLIPARRAINSNAKRRGLLHEMCAILAPKP